MNNEKLDNYYTQIEKIHDQMKQDGLIGSFIFICLNHDTQGVQLKTLVNSNAGDLMMARKILKNEIEASFMNQKMDHVKQMLKNLGDKKEETKVQA